MKKAMQWIFGGSVLLSLLLSVTASADTQMPLTSEMMGIENVLAVISNVNIRQVDSKTNQTVTDIMDAKSQMEQPGLLLAQPAKPTQVATFGKRPPSSRNRHTF
jgi:hypothetical protein